LAVTTGIANMFRVEELRKRLLFSVAILLVYRIGIHITVPGVDRQVMHDHMQSKDVGFLGLFDLFSGGGLEQLSIFALGIMPYVSSSIIFQLLGVVVPAIEKLQKEGEAGRRKINQYTRYGTIVLSLVQGFGIGLYLESLNVGSRLVVPEDHRGWVFRILTVITLTAGTAFIMWLGEQVTERGIGNGTSLIIFAGIVARIPAAVGSTVQLFQKSDEMTPLSAILLVAIMVATVALICFFERGQRRIPVQYAKRVVGRRQFGGHSTHLPLKVNSSGVIPPIFASSILVFPATVAGYVPALKPFSDGILNNGWVHNSLYVVGIVLFAYFYTAVTFNPVDVADNMKKNGGYVPGIRPGKQTAEYIDLVLSRITFGGALYLSAVCVLPSIIADVFRVNFQFGGTALLIVVGVALDTVQQIEGHLITRHYEGFTGARGPRIRGRRDTSGQSFATP
jgi:preprotein translocase subunit SecY